jgi:uncharacterized damage-inducible protein DinB
MSREFWLEGPVEGIPPHLQPVAHALLQARHDLRVATDGIPVDQLWRRLGDAASLGFHLRHIAGSMDRLVSYALGRDLDEGQRDALAAEKTEAGERPTLEALLTEVDATVEKTLLVLRAIPASSLTEARAVGRARRPSTVLGLLFHAAEHTQRHTGQVIATAKGLRGS